MVGARHQLLPLAAGSLGRLDAVGLRDSYRRRPENLVADPVSMAYDADDDAILIGTGRWNRGHGFVQQRIERLTLRFDTFHPEAFQLREELAVDEIHSLQQRSVPVG